MAGRKANVFNKIKLTGFSIDSIINRTVEFDCKVRGVEVTTKETLKCDALVKVLMGVSGDRFNTKSCISDKLIDAILCGEKAFINKIDKEVVAFSGYKYDNIQDMVYYLTWFALTDVEPEYKTLKEYAEAVNAA